MGRADMENGVADSYHALGLVCFKQHDAPVSGGSVQLWADVWSGPRRNCSGPVNREVVGKGSVRHGQALLEVCPD